MAETIPGGAYLNGDTWVDAEGKPLKKEAIAAAKAKHDENAAQTDEQHRAALALEAQRNPTAQAIAAAMAPKNEKKSGKNAAASEDA